ncbi:glycosyltransferase family 1 protein [Spirosoma sp. RP8]|uniref:Glycosyltransferase family 1 protein n=1 Tax=Spirosoma liriopis TaxID=2937440 RepID=A0ABT0HQU2_9BACT|nr:glycosyltransferase family 1 protein [Spirosoma liriopis]MCK8493925.1 glycosyltransferase family 1 protein [Spirosoma liriopis]
MTSRIALISDHASPLATIGGIDAGGQNIAVAELAKELARLGYWVDVFTRLDSPSVPDVVHWQPRVRVIHVAAGPPKYIPKEHLLPVMDDFAEKMAQFIQRENSTYRVIHAHFFMSGVVAMRLRQLLGIPFVITFHALGAVRQLCQGTKDGFPAERTAIEKQLVQKASGVVALCPQDAADLQTLYGANPAKLTIIPNGYNPTDFFPLDQGLARASAGLDPEEPVILQLGRLVPRKGIDNVVRALAVLPPINGRKARLLVVGGESATPDPVLTPEIGRLQQLATSLGVADQVTFIGSRARSQLRTYYSAADVFVTTPWYEPFGITPLESMACGTPVVGSSVGGIKHTVIPGVTGYLVPPESPKLLADQLAVVLGNENLRQRMGKAAVKHVQAGYTWKHVAQQTADLYDLVCTGRTRVGIRMKAAH